MSIRDHVREGTFFERLRRYPQRGWVAGVCAGLAEFFDWNVKLIRVLFVVGLIFSGFFPLGVIYLVLWYLMDPADADTRREAAHDDARRGTNHGASTADLKARFARLEERLRNMEACVTSDEFELRRELRKLEG
ncbi:envelope stress response membrane protein PspC [Fontimonas sp. SYSU GA230001]|uniref:envelope stress response membrane protein PspC n=1 Tax=Fontimonas sp. SYSU GA230001 TaxID=3142450 RepID=UPI0032B33F0D